MKANRNSQSQRRREFKYQPAEERVLVAVMNNGRDLAIAQNEGWYRIPVRSAPREMAFGWLAFYLTKSFGADGLSVSYLARVTGQTVVRRRDLLPAEADHPRADEAYHRIDLSKLERLTRPIRSLRGRRLVFIPTTLEKLRRAGEINDLFHESPLEDELWDAFKTQQIAAERQWYLPVAQRFYCLDFALFCRNCPVDVECDGDTWHSQRAQIAEDNERDNALASHGWSVLRFNTRQVMEETAQCVGIVRETINHHGGLVTVDGGQSGHPPSSADSGQSSLIQEAPAEYGEVVD